MKDGWRIKTLEELCEFGNGLWKGKKPPYIKVGVIRNTNFTKDCKLDDSDIVHLDVERSQFVKRKLQYGDIILEKSGGGPNQPVGRVVIFDKGDGDYSFSNFTSSIRIKNKSEVDFTYLHRYLFFEYMSGATEEMQSHSTGIRNLKTEEYRKIKISYPSLSEQKRIVYKLDQALVAIEKAKVNVENNLRNQMELFESFLQIAFDPRDNWKEESLDKIADSNCTLSYGIVQPGNDFSDGLPIVRPTDLTRKFIQLKGLKLIKPSLAESYKRTTLTGRELLLCVRGTTGTVSISTKELKGANVTRGIVPIRFDREIMILEFGYYLFVSPFVQKQIKEKTYGAALMQINIGDLRKIKVLVPPLNEQTRVVEILDSISDKTKRLEYLYRQKICSVEALKSSLLKQAFAGELIKETKTLIT